MGWKWQLIVASSLAVAVYYHSFKPLCYLLSIQILRYGVNVMVVRFGGRGVSTKWDPEDYLAFSSEKETIERRIITFEGVVNARDLGGYLTSSGKVIRTGSVFRSGELHSMTERDRELFNELQIDTVIDLRVNIERSQKPNPDLPCKMVRIIPEGYMSVVQIVSRIFSMFWISLFNRRKLPDSFKEYYIEMIDNGRSSWVELINTIAEAKAPVLVHCKNGKDRTGISSALLLSLLGVPDDLVVEDYSLTNLHLQRAFDEYQSEDSIFKKMGIPLEEMRTAFLADPKWMRNMLSHIRSSYGDVETYLQCDRSTIDKLKVRMLE